jgi:hypothetical protein
MNTIRPLAVTYLLASLINCAAATPDPDPTLLGQSASETLVAAAPIIAPRLSLDLPPAKSIPDSGPIPILRNSSNLPRPGEVMRHPLNIDSAERVNEHAMRDYREKWDSFGKAPGSLPLPVLYPSRVHRTYEATR